MFNHVYVHVPFCDGKCVYCGFYSELLRPRDSAGYLRALASEIDRRIQTPTLPAPETIYLGGGTPAVLPHRQLAELCDIIRQRFSLALLKEWTVEANPGTLPPAKAAMLRAKGVTRISIGAQSFRDAVLTRLGRRHAARDIAATVRSVRGAGIDNIGLDLIAALPGVSVAQWKETLERCIALNPRHVSVYALTVEPKTILRRLVRDKRLALPGEEEQIDAMAVAGGMLRAGGFTRYEISNFAQPGFECVHNLSFWRGGDYVGFGPGASSRIGLRRWSNRPDLASYAAAAAAARLPPSRRERLSPAADAAERLAFAFRLREGVDLSAFCAERAVPPSLLQRWTAILERLASHGLTRRRGARWTLTPRGRDLSDAVAAELL